MQWYKHMTDMRYDVKMRRLIRRFGLEGYGLYNVIIESIVGGLSDESPIPDLEEESRDIAEYFGADTAKVEEIMWFCITEGLLEQDEMSGAIIAHKVYKFLQQNATSSIKIRDLIKNYKAAVGKSQTLVTESQSHVTPSQPQVTESQQNVNRLDKTRQDKTRTDSGKKGPHFDLANEWYKRYNRAIATMVSPSEKDYKKSHELLQRVDLDTARKAIELYFTVQDWPQWDSKKQKWNYNFASFCANIETILSQQPEKEDTVDVFTDDDVLGVEAENF